MSNIGTALVNVLNVIKEDWDRLSKFLKFCYLTGAFLLLATPLMKVDNKSYIQVIGLGLFVFFIIIAPFLNWAWVHIVKIQWYRWRYNISKLGKRFVFGTLEGTDAIHIFDLKWKRIRWIENPTTGYDLGYFPSAWRGASGTFKSFNGTLEVDSKKIDLSKYKIKQRIHTRGKPGLKLD